jgi:hypothetical protein
LAGIETMHMLRKGQLDDPERKVAAAPTQFYSLPSQRGRPYGFVQADRLIATEPI